jgi:outer membrane protein
MRFPVRLAAAALALSVAAPALSAQTAPKIAFVEVATLMDQAPGRAEAQSQFEKEAQAIRAELQRMSDSLDTMIQAYQKTQSTLSATQRETREKDLQTRQQGFQQRAQALQARGQAREQELVGGFEKLVRDAIDDVRTTEGYAMIFAGGPNSAMLSADKSLDITDKVLARMRTIAAARPAVGANSTTPAPAGARPGAPVAAPAGPTRPRVPTSN